MSENITHTAIVDDSIRIGAVDPRQPELFATVLRGHHELARLGGITRAGDRCNPELLRLARARIEAGSFDPGGMDGAKLAFVLGWLSHRAADRSVKKVLRDLDGDCPQTPRDCSIYHDVCVLREVYGLAGGPYDADLFASEAGKPTAGLAPAAFAAVDRLVRIALQRSLIDIHTLIPEVDDAEAWIERLVAVHQRHRVDLERYARAVTDPDPDRWQRFIVDGNFYDGEDPWIAAARALQRGESPDVDALGAHRCVYGHALSRAVGYQRAAARYIAGGIDTDGLLEALEIGRPELAG